MNASSRSTPSPILVPNYRRLPNYMYKESMPEAAVSPQLLALNTRLLEALGQDLTWFNSPDALAQLSGQSYYASNLPLALAYSGHQFGGWSALLGDGRAHLLGQLKTQTGELIDVQLKGSGATAFSRGGDGRATLGAVIREYLISEAMAGLKIATTGSMAVITTGDTVWRDIAHPGAILVRTAKSHIRVGSFQYAAAHHGNDAVKALADFTIAEHYPDALKSDTPYAEFLAMVIARQARLVAQWMLVGFIHGVMNTDNSSITGETIDYGPCAFMDEFKLDKVFSSIDSQGRYAWGNQGSIAQWNMARFAETLLPLLNADETQAQAVAQTQLSRFSEIFSEHFYSGMAKKLALVASADKHDLVDMTLQLLSSSSVDFTQFFDRLTEHHCGGTDDNLLALFSDSGTQAQLLQDWLTQWRDNVSSDPKSQAEMRQANPKIVARNHKVEAAIFAAEKDHNYAPFFDMVRVLANPYQLDQTDTHYQDAPSKDERVTRTFCGT